MARSWSELNKQYVFVKIHLTRNTEIDNHLKEVIKKEKISDYVSRLVEKDIENAEKH